MAINDPFVSIIVPCYEQEEFLDEALKSVFNQNYLNWECIIVNDGSTDQTELIARKWLNSDNRFSYFFQKNRGLVNARNLGISKAKGFLILPLDADDKISTEYIGYAVREFKNDSTLKLVYCRAQKFGEINEIWDLPPFSLSNLSKKNIIFSSGVYKKVDWQRLGGYDENMLYGWEDWEFWIALLKKGGRVKCLDHVGFFYRIKKVSMSTNIDREKSKYLLEYLSVKHSDFFVKYYGSFKSLEEKYNLQEASFKRKLKSKKFVLNLFLETFLCISISKERRS